MIIIIVSVSVIVIIIINPDCIITLSRHGSQYWFCCDSLDWSYLNLLDFNSSWFILIDFWSNFNWVYLVLIASTSSPRTLPVPHAGARPNVRFFAHATRATVFLALGRQSHYLRLSQFRHFSSPICNEDVGSAQISFLRATSSSTPASALDPSVLTRDLAFFTVPLTQPPQKTLRREKSRSPKGNFSCQIS